MSVRAGEVSLRQGRVAVQALGQPGTPLAIRPTWITPGTRLSPLRPGPLEDSSQERGFWFVSRMEGVLSRVADRPGSGTSECASGWRFGSLDGDRQQKGKGMS